MGISGTGATPSIYPAYSDLSSLTGQRGNAVAPVTAPLAQEDTDTFVSLSLTSQTLTEEEQHLVDKLEARDAEVREHEMKHISASAGLQVSGPTYEYETGPDNKQYAINGEVQIDVSPARTPEETIDKAERIRAAALAPPEPSAQDIRVAAQATQMGLEAKQELARQREDTSQSPQEQLANVLQQIFSPNNAGKTINVYA